MQESFLYYIWKFQYFDKKDLTTCQGDALNITKPGMRNEDSGPDFLNGSVVIKNVAWHGQIEVHVNASDWYAHKHQNDKDYENVILHVVWNYDRNILHPDGTSMPTLELKNRVSPNLYNKYLQFINADTPIPCSKHLPNISSLIKGSMLDKALFQRLTNRNNLIYKLLSDNSGDWDETAYQLLVYNFGVKVNNNSFLDLALSLPFKTILKCADNILQIEALLLGQAGLLSEMKNQDQYFTELKEMYSYLTHKFNLTANLTASQWKFFKLRPAAFPTIRIAQLAQILHHYPNVFSILTGTPTKSFYKTLAVKQSNYWQHHYRFGNLSKSPIPGLGRASIEGILINTVVPLLVTYGKAKDEQDYVDRAVAILQHLPTEKNKITRYWEEAGIKVRNAFDAQASIELFNDFCSQKRCLSCSIGIDIMGKEGFFNPLTEK